MNKKKGSVPFKKVLICLLTMVIVIMSTPTPVLIESPHSKLVYSISVAKESDDNYFIPFVNLYIKELQQQGYRIASEGLNKENINRTIFEKYLKASSTLDDDSIDDKIRINVFATQITIGTEIFYFKNSTDALAFVDKLNEQIKTEYLLVENMIIDKSEITSQNILNKKIEDAKTERQKIEQRQRELEEARKTTVCFPLASYIYVSSSYGSRWGTTHRGIDLAAKSETHVYAWKNGKVISANWNGGYGNCVLVEHADGTVSRYAHLSGYNCSVGTEVAAGQVIGYVGSTGNSTGPHLHFEIIVNGSTVNPASYIGL